MILESNQDKFKFRVLGLFEERKEDLELFLRLGVELCLKSFIRPLFGFNGINSNSDIIFNFLRIDRLENKLKSFFLHRMPCVMKCSRAFVAEKNLPCFLSWTNCHSWPSSSKTKNPLEAFKNGRCGDSLFNWFL